MTHRGRNTAGKCTKCAAGSFCPPGSNVAVSCGTVLAAASTSAAGRADDTDCVCIAGHYIQALSLFPHSIAQKNNVLTRVGG